MGRRLEASDPTKATRHKPSEVEVRNIAHPKVWKTAMSVAGGKAELLRVVRYGEVVVMLNA